ncbi:keywimysin-related RiPP [Streptomyces cupreus]|uniref:Lasso RiPP family leader peptide-containing protein n=1 Tax=Streptomyces cupreus TaxID=2759956 RepID=A0A7X1JBC9_9ACTN|nr:lasso RiPP family leader peptide-containing protein [Streptomyces cupreus]
MRIYERPTLTAIGSFKKLTGLGGQGPKDVLFRHQLL